MRDKLSRTPRAAESFSAHDSNTFDTYADESVTLLKPEYDSLIQKMHLVFTSDIATLTHSGISCLVSSLISSWIIDSGASTHITRKYTVFFTFHTSSVPSIVFAYDNSKCSTGAVNLTSLALTDVNYIPRVPFNLTSMSHLTKNFQCSIICSPSSCTFQDFQTKVTGEGYEHDSIYYLQCNHQSKVGASVVMSL